MDINEIASQHLGKAGDGTVVKPYVTPDYIDASLLVGVPRHLNREQYDIKGDGSDIFVGVDTWNSYEFSCLLDNGFPVSGQLKWAYPSDSDCIVESKSAKLYLNSYNMAKMGATVEEAIINIEEQVAKDLEGVLGIQSVGPNLDVCLFTDEVSICQPLRDQYILLEDYVDVADIAFNHYNEDPAILDVKYNDSNKIVKYRSKSLRSNCRVTNQPDWGDVYIYIKGEKVPTPESLLQYVVSMRKENHFHEEICECIYKRLHDLLGPEELMVTCLYTRRGGIDINPIRASNKQLLWAQPISDGYNLTTKTMRQ